MYTNEYTKTLGDTTISGLRSESHHVLRPPDSPEGEIVLLSRTVATHYTAYNQRRIDTRDITRAGVSVELSRSRSTWICCG